MKRQSPIEFLQRIFGLAKSEIVAVLVILFGLALGAVVQLYDQEDRYQYSQLNRELDRLTQAAQWKTSRGKTFAKRQSSRARAFKIGKININSASKSELDRLPGVGPKTAEKIIRYRKKRPFKTIYDIMKVKGIGRKKFEKMRAFIVVR